MDPKTVILLAALLAILTPSALADGPGRIYTQVSSADTGVLAGRVTGAVLTHAIAVERDLTRVYLATLDRDGAGFHFECLPVGRFDLVLVTTNGRVIEGLGLGAPEVLDEDRARHLGQAVAKADSFFNRQTQHRAGFSAEAALVFTERIRDAQIVRGSGEPLNASLRRLEIIELRRAQDDWQMVNTRHIYREEARRQPGIPFLAHLHLPALAALRVGDSPRNLGTIDLTK